MTNKTKDRLERLFWTVVAGVLSVLAVELAGIDVWWAAAALPGVNAVLIWVRQHIDVLPDPGEGLPGALVDPWEGVYLEDGFESGFDPSEGAGEGVLGVESPAPDPHRPF